MDQTLAFVGEDVALQHLDGRGGFVLGCARLPQPIDQSQDFQLCCIGVGNAVLGTDMLRKRLGNVSRIVGLQVVIELLDQDSVVVGVKMVVDRSADLLNSLDVTTEQAIDCSLVVAN
jgi:hypothetical protein